jgi:UDP-glucose 4-epimerase
MTKCVLLTGGAGFIGSAIARALLARGARVVVADNLSTGYRSNVPADCEFVEMDLGDRGHYQKLANIRFDAVFHLGGQSSGEASFLDPWYDYNSHVTSTFMLLSLCRDRGVPRFLYASSMSVYGDPKILPVTEQHTTQPKTFYAAAKLAAEGYIKLHQTLGLDTTIFRMFSVYGPNQNLANRMQGMASIYLSYLLEGKPILVRGSPERFRDFIFVDDVVTAWLAAYDNPRSSGRLYNLATGSRITVKQLLDEMLDAAGKPDYPIEFAGNTPGDQFGMVADVSLIKDELGWAPRWNLRAGLRKTIESHRAAMARG